MTDLAAALRAMRQRQYAERVQQDREIGRLRKMGWSYARIASAVDLCPEAVRRRAVGMGLSGTPFTRSAPFTLGMTPAGVETYRLYRKNGYAAAEARALALQSQGA